MRVEIIQSDDEPTVKYQLSQTLYQTYFANHFLYIRRSLLERNQTIPDPKGLYWPFPLKESVWPEVCDGTCITCPLFGLWMNSSYYKSSSTRICSLQFRRKSFLRNVNKFQLVYSGPLRGAEAWWCTWPFGWKSLLSQANTQVRKAEVVKTPLWQLLSTRIHLKKASNGVLFHQNL